MSANQPTYTTYKGHKLIVLNPGERFPFQFGQAKAQMIVENYEAISLFAGGNGDEYRALRKLAEFVQTKLKRRSDTAEWIELNRLCADVAKAQGRKALAEPDRFDMQVEDNMRDACGA